MVNGVSGSATTQHIEAPINANNTHLGNQSRFFVKINFFALGLQFQNSLSIAHRFACGRVF